MPTDVFNIDEVVDYNKIKHLGDQSQLMVIATSDRRTGLYGWMSSLTLKGTPWVLTEYPYKSGNVKLWRRRMV